MAGRYKVYIVPSVWNEIKSLPGFVRHRVKKAIGTLAENPHPPKSRELRQPHPSREVRRLRIDNWRILYAFDSNDKIVDIIAVRKRPPYNYDDLAELIAEHF